MTNLEKEQIIKVIEIFLPNAKIYLFGSRARGDYSISSDIDIAIDSGERIGIALKAQISNMIDALNIPQKTDIVDFNTAPKYLKDSILKDGILWKS